MVGENGESMYFSGVFTSNKFSALPINNKFSSNQYVGNVNTTNCPYTFKLEASNTEPYYYIKLSTGVYLGYDSSTLVSNSDLDNLTFKLWKPVFDEETKKFCAYIDKNGDLLTNSGLSFGTNNSFKYFNMYATSNQKITYLYKKVEDVAPSPTTQAVTITDAGWATYFNTEHDLDFSGTGAKVYKAKVRNDKEYVDLIPVTKVPKDEGVIINYDGGGTLNVPIITDVPAWAAADNDLICCTESFAVTEAYRYYILMSPFAFYPVTTETTNNNNVIPKGRCYLDLGASSPAKPVSISPVFGTTTGISTISRDDSKTTCRNLLGIPVSTNTPGIVIINGKKVINKR